MTKKTGTSTLAGKSKIKALVEKYKSFFNDSKHAYIDCGEGWADLIEPVLVSIEQDAETRGLEPVILQVKEKFGGLRLYATRISPETADLIHSAELLSFQTCEFTGNLGSMHRSKTGWMKTIGEAYAKQTQTEYGWTRIREDA